MKTMSNYAKINKYDIANGPGVRVSVFFSGCEHYCKGCFNSEAWDFEYGERFTYETIDEIIEAMKPSYIKGLTVLGGEPMHNNNAYALLKLCEAVKNKYPDKTIWVYTGYTYEELEEMNIFAHTKLLNQFIDVLVDGRFIEDLKDITLRFKGSSNQRIIDIKATRATQSITLWSDWQHDKKGII